MLRSMAEVFQLREAVALLVQVCTGPNRCPGKWGGRDAEVVGVCRGCNCGSVGEGGVWRVVWDGRWSRCGRAVCCGLWGGRARCPTIASHVVEIEGTNRKSAFHRNTSLCTLMRVWRRFESAFFKQSRNRSLSAEVVLGACSDAGDDMHCAFCTLVGLPISRIGCDPCSGTSCPRCGAECCCGSLLVSAVSASTLSGAPISCCVLSSSRPLTRDVVMLWCPPPLCGPRPFDDLDLPTQKCFTTVTVALVLWSGAEHSRL